MQSPQGNVEDPSTNTVHDSSWSAVGLGHKLLIFAALLLVGFFAFQFWTSNSGLILLVESVVFLALVLVPFGPKLIRGVLFAALAINVASAAINTEGTISGEAEVPGMHLAPWGFLICLIVAIAFESQSLLSSSKRDIFLKSLVWIGSTVPALIYIVGIPIASWAIGLLNPEPEPTTTYQVPEWNLMNEISFRTAQFAVFGIFTYIGACAGSFLNVVAYSIPRGEGIALRDSKCPQCSTKIKRIDNLPIFSYLNLGGRCRSCSEPIPYRYLLVELMAAAIFGSLFCYELITGVTNVPSFQNFWNTGILWIILYPKWPAIGIYIYHCLFMCALLTMALIEWDQHRIKHWQAVLCCVVFFACAAVYFPLQPVPTLAHLEFIPIELPLIADQLFKLAIGLLLGSAIGAALSVFGNKWNLIPAVALSGTVLGWQGLMQVLGVFAAVYLISVAVPPLRWLSKNCPTLLLFIAVFLHHPFWRRLAEYW